MPVIIINPNSTASMTDAMVRQARLAAPGLEFEGWTSQDGPPAIQGPEDGEAATAPLLDLVTKAASAQAAGIIIGCFDDTALDQAATLASCPVIGIGQAAFHYAALRQWRFSVVTTLAVSVPIIEANINRYGLTNFVSKVRASDVPVLALEDDADRAGQRVADEALRAQEQDEIAAVIMGCAGMVGVAQTVENTVALKVIDPVSCAAQSMTWLA